MTDDVDALIEAARTWTPTETSLSRVGASRMIQHLADALERLSNDHTDSEKALIDSVNKLIDERDEALAVIEHIRREVTPPYTHRSSVHLAVVRGILEDVPPSAALNAVKAAAWDEALAHVQKLSDPASTINLPPDRELITLGDVAQAKDENPYRKEEQ